MELQLLSFNCYDHPRSLSRIRRITKLASEILRLKPDIVCLQEISFADTAHKLSNTLQEKGYDTFYQADRFINHGGLFLASLSPLKSCAFTRFPKQGFFLSTQIGDAFLRKGYQQATISVNKRSITFFNTHLVSVYRKDSQRQANISMAQIKQLSEAIHAEKAPVIATGDFNFTPNEQQYSFFLQQTQLTDPFSGCDIVTVSKTNTNRQGLYKCHYNEKIDYTFLSQSIKLKNQKVIFDDMFPIGKRQLHLSDHFGLLTTIEI